MLDFSIQLSLLLSATIAATIVSRMLLSFVGMYSIDGLWKSVVGYVLVTVVIQFVNVAFGWQYRIMSMVDLLITFLVFTVVWFVYDVLTWKFLNRGLHPRQTGSTDSVA